MPLTDKPDDRLFEDDAALDRWYDAYIRDMARKSARAGGSGYNTPTIEVVGGTTA